MDNYLMQHSWRWFGPDDPVSLEEIRQTGAKSIVTALHQVPTGEAWPVNLILERKRLIEEAGLTWSVVESVPVHEDIKMRRGDYQMYINRYIETISNLGAENIKTLCYNFMPVLDWSRTDLKFKSPDGSETLLFDFTYFAIIDIFLLRRPKAADDYPIAIKERASELFEKMSPEKIETLKETFLLGLPGSGETFSMEQVLNKIDQYREITKEKFKSNLVEFIREIAPAAEKSGVMLAIHPDDPPWSLMGLPKAVSTIDDALDIINACDIPNNGITFCTGSFGASPENDLPLMAEKLAGRINFAHLRNVTRDDQFNFHENYLLEGDIDIYRIMKTLVLENNRRSSMEPGYHGIPIRPDHGAQILGDFQRQSYPGYSLYGRMKSLAEIKGLEIGILNNLLKEE